MCQKRWYIVVEDNLISFGNTKKVQPHLGFEMRWAMLAKGSTSNGSLHTKK